MNNWLEKAILFAEKNSVVSAVRETASNSEIKAYIVGGYLRDFILGNDPLDIDFIVESHVKDFAEALNRKVSGKLIVLGKEPLVNYRIAHRGMIYDFVEAVDGNIAADLSRRDFTMNTIALDLATWQLHDDFSGVKDTGRRIIREVTPSSLLDDPVRIMRGIRYSAVIEGAAIEQNTLHNMSKYSEKLIDCAAERIVDEFRKIFTGVNVSKAVESLFEIQFPEHLMFRDFKRKKNVSESFVNDEKRNYVETSIKHIERSCSSETFSLLFGDDKDWKVKRITYISSFLFLYSLFYEFLGGKLNSIVKAFRFSNDEKSLIINIYSGIYELIETIKENLSDNKIRIFIGNKGKNAFLSLVILSAFQRTDGFDQNAINTLSRHFISIIKEEGENLLNPEKLISGNDVKKYVHIRNASDVGKLLKVVRDLQFQGIIKTRDDALAYLREQSETTEKPIKR